MALCTSGSPNQQVRRVWLELADINIEFDGEL